MSRYFLILSTFFTNYKCEGSYHAITTLSKVVFSVVKEDTRFKFIISQIPLFTLFISLVCVIKKNKQWLQRLVLDIILKVSIRH